MKPITTLCKKDSNEILQKYVTVISSIKSAIPQTGYRFHLKAWRGRGRHISLSDCDHRACIELFDAIGIEYTTGNDAPRGGIAGDYIEIASSKSARKLGRFFDSLRYEEIRENFSHKNLIFFK